MHRTIYIEETLLQHPRVIDIKKRFPEATYIICERYTEIFNRKAQNFRLQKKQPALILAEKYKKLVLPTPTNYAIGAENNYYFSHMLNCIYDCRYCFLQGMFRSAHHVFFVNFEDFAREIKQTVSRHDDGEVHFFSGYDCDSLALDAITGFTGFFLDIFENLPTALLELRTKSIRIKSLLAREPIPNCVIACSFTPDEISKAIEYKTPAVSRRIEAMQKLQKYGWKLGLRFDPLIYNENFKNQYDKLFNTVFSVLETGSLHSVSLGSFRLPRDYFRKIQRLYPDETLLASPFSEGNGLVGYRHNIQNELMSYCSEQIRRYIPADIFFPCHETTV